MRKILVGSLAVLAAVSLVAFTTPKAAPRADVFFQYTGSTFTQAAVQNTANWVEVSSTPPSCNGIDHKACWLKVSDTATTGAAPNRTLACGIYVKKYNPDGTHVVVIFGCVVDVRNKN